MATHQPPGGRGLGVPQAVSVSSLRAHVSLSTPAASLGNPDSGHEGNGSFRPRPSQCWVPGCRADVLKGRRPLASSEGMGRCDHTSRHLGPPAHSQSPSRKGQVRWGNGPKDLV